MLPNFTTTITTDLPTVLLVGRKTALLEAIARFFEDNNLNVLHRSEENLGIIKNTTPYYKIVWVIDPKNLEEKQIEAFKEAIQTTTEPLIIVFPLTTGIKNHETYPQWSTFSQKQKGIISHLSASFVTAYFVFLENLLQADVASELFTFFLEKLNSGYILQPQVSLSLLDENTALKAMKEPLFRPGFHQSILIKGQDFSSESLSVKTLQAYKKKTKELELTKVPITTLPIIGFKVQEKIVQAEVDEILKWQLTHLPPINLDNKKDIGLIKPQLPVIEHVKNSQIIDPSQNKVTITQQTTAVIEPISEVTAAPVVPDVAIKTQFKSENEVQQELQRIFVQNRTEKKIQRVIHISDVEKKIVKKSKHKKILFWGGLGVVGSGVAVFCLIIIFYMSTQYVTKNLVSTMHAVMSNEKTEPNFEMLSFSTAILAFQTDHYSAFIDNPTLSQSAELVSLSNNIQELSQSASASAITAVSAYKAILNGGNNSTTELFSTLENNSKKTHELIATVQTQLDQVVLPSENGQDNHLESFKSALQDEFKKTSVVQQLAPLLPDLTGVKSERTYAIIFQNNQELRPTGGFIQSVALVTANQGSIVETEFVSSYDLDAKMSGVATPPEEITQLLGEERWYLRDSNWNPDFSVSSQDIISLIENSTSKKLNGVFAIDVYGLEKILATTGPIELPQYNEVITDKNVSERLEFHSEVTFIDKENNPDYSTVLFSTIFSRLRSLDDQQIINIYDALQVMFKENNLMISMTDQNELMSIKSLGWSGSIITPDCPSALGSVDCFVDTFAQYEANIGINKANYYLEKSINHIVTMNESSLAHKRTITYKNTAQTNTWPKGNYKAYVRLYVPKNATLQSIFYNTSPIPLEQITIKEMNDRRVIGFVIDVPINTQSIVEVDYVEDFVNTLPYSYAFFEQKQPGTPVIPFTLTVVPPATATPVLIAPEAQLHSQTVLFQEQQRSHVFYGIQFE